MSKYNLIDIYEQYQIGSGWTRDFDYDGMLKAGLKTGVDTDIELLKKMAEDYTDVNYHREASHLYNAIEALEENAIKEASMFFGDFHAEIEETMKSQGMDIEPTLGKFMNTKMKEGEEAPTQEGVEEDPFHAEDVIEHLSIEMIKHLDDIQAQGDRLAGFDQQEFTAIDEEDSIEEALPKFKGVPPMRDIVKALKAANAQDSEIKQYMASVKRAGDEFDDVDDYVEDFNEYVANKGLAEHFGRFMKDYQ